MIWREINAEYKNLHFHHFKKTMCNIGYRSTKDLVSFSKVPVKFRNLNKQNIVLYRPTKLEFLKSILVNFFPYFLVFLFYAFTLFFVIFRASGSID